MTFDPTQITPPPELVREWDTQWHSQNHTDRTAWVCATGARWGAAEGYAAGRQEWPEPITDRAPTGEDGDDEWQVQFHSPMGRWDFTTWEICAERGAPWAWLHTPRWRPPAPKEPTLRERALAIVTKWEHGGHMSGDNVATLRRALECDVQPPT